MDPQPNNHPKLVNELYVQESHARRDREIQQMLGNAVSYGVQRPAPAVIIMKKWNAKFICNVAM